MRRKKGVGPTENTSRFLRYLLRIIRHVQPLVVTKEVHNVIKNMAQSVDTFAESKNI